MGKLISISFITLFILISCAIKENTTLRKDKQFPKDWVGDYYGELQLFSVDSVGMRIPMKFSIKQLRDSVFQWKMVYDPKGRNDIRDYELKIKNSDKGHYIIDEKNSILIDAFYKNKTLTSQFEVMNNLIMTSTKFDFNDNLIFEVFSSTKKNKTISGNTVHQEDSIPKVTSYLINGRQKAILTKIK